VRLGILFAIFALSLSWLGWATRAYATEPCNPDGSPAVLTDEALLNAIIGGLNGGLDNYCHSESCQKLVNWEADNARRYPYCAGFFMDEQGKPGPLATVIGKLIASDIRSNGTKSVFMEDYSQFVAACPAFSKLSGPSKVGFYTWFFEVLAYPETTCNPNRRLYAPNVPNGPAVGLYQLEYDPKLRSWRGPHCGVSRQEIMTPQGNSACAFDIFKDQLQNYHNPFGSIDAKGRRTQTDYWQSLNPTPPPKPVHAVHVNGRLVQPKKQHETAYARVQRYLGYYPLCHPDPTQTGQ
jgi:hypothetical protein